jgi:anthranilate synthase/aminodeoxychorismate synthase-like glutamine amidotransferase
MKILLIDNYDSFTYNLYDYLLQNNVACDVVKNDVAIDGIEFNEYSGIVISPGPKTPKEAGITNEILKRYFDKKPILGICLGHQAIGVLFGAELGKANYPMHGKTSTIKISPHYIFEGLGNVTEVMRYHSLILKNIKSPLHVIATTNVNEVMAIAHENNLLCGIQFHPESVLTPKGFTIISNWIKHVKNLTFKS